MSNSWADVRDGDEDDISNEQFMNIVKNTQSPSDKNEVDLSIEPKSQTPNHTPKTHTKDQSRKSNPARSSRGNKKEIIVGSSPWRRGVKN